MRKKKIWDGVPEAEWTVEIHIAKLDYEWERLEEKETRRHVSFDAYPSLDEDGGRGGGHTISLDEFVHRHGKHAPSAEDEAERRETILTVRTAIERLRPSHKAIVCAVFYLGYSLSEYAALRGVSRAAASIQMKAAKKNLKKFLKNT
jgi:RNA polymerase sigma factor (sigma-70 family)